MRLHKKGKLFMYSPQLTLSASRINSAMMDYLAFFLSALEIPAFAQMKPRRNVVTLASFKSVSTSQVKKGKFSHCVNERCPMTLSRWLNMMSRSKINLQIHSSCISSSCTSPQGCGSQTPCSRNLYNSLLPSGLPLKRFIKIISTSCGFYFYPLKLLPLPSGLDKLLVVMVATPFALAWPLCSFSPTTRFSFV